MTQSFFVLLKECKTMSSTEIENKISNIVEMEVERSATERASYIVFVEHHLNDGY